MVPPTPYLHLPGTARQALSLYADVFGGRGELHTFEEFGRTDGPAAAVAHGYLVDCPVKLYVADVAGDEPPLHTEGLMLSLLGTAEAATLRGWWTRLAERGTVLDALQPRPWGAWDGQVVDPFGVHWLIGFEDEPVD